MMTLINRVRLSRGYRLFSTFSAWMIFISVVLILTNAFSSLEKIKEYGFLLPDVALTYGFLIFWGGLEALAISLGLTGIELLLEKITRKNLEQVFRLLLAAGLLASWVMLALSIFHVV